MILAATSALAQPLTRVPIWVDFENYEMECRSIVELDVALELATPKATTMLSSVVLQDVDRCFEPFRKALMAVGGPKWECGVTFWQAYDRVRQVEPHWSELAFLASDDPERTIEYVYQNADPC